MRGRPKRAGSPAAGTLGVVTGGVGRVSGCVARTGHAIVSTAGPCAVVVGTVVVPAVVVGPGGAVEITCFDASRPTTLTTAAADPATTSTTESVSAATFAARRRRARASNASGASYESRQLRGAIVQRPPHLVFEVVRHGCSDPRAARIDARPRDVADFTVPTGTPSATAAWSSDMSR